MFKAKLVYISLGQAGLHKETWFQKTNKGRAKGPLVVGLTQQAYGSISYNAQFQER